MHLPNYSDNRKVPPEDKQTNKAEQFYSILNTY